MIRNAVAEAVAPVSCALVGGDVNDQGTLTLQGAVSRANAGMLQSAVVDAAPTAPRAWRVSPFDGPYCKLLDALRPFAKRFGTPGVDVDIGLRNGQKRLVKDDFIVARATMPDFQGYLTVDYFTNDGSLVHLYPPGKDAPKQLAALSNVTMGDAVAGAQRWQVDQPFGTDLIVAIASSQRLFPQNRPDDDSVDGYIRDLQAALASAQQRGARIATRAFVLETAPK